MYTLTRKLSVVCLTVVLSFLVYGCGGSSKQALITDVSTDMVTADLKPAPGTYSIQPGGTANAGDVTFACPGPAEGPPCEVTVDEDGNIVMSPSAEGMATAMDSASATARLAAQQAQADAEQAQAVAEQAQADAEQAQADAEQAQADAEQAQADAEQARDDAEGDTAAAEQARDDALAAQVVAEQARDDALAAQAAAVRARDAAVEELRLANLRLDPNDVDLGDLLENFTTITPGTYNIDAGGDPLDVDDATFTCPAGGLACEITVADDGTVTSAGGMATAQNSMAANTSKMAIALTATNGALLTNVATDDGQPTGVDVKRAPNGITTITLTPDDDEDGKYARAAVDAGHVITGWTGQTLKRNNAITETETDNAEPATSMHEATIYTDIVSARAAKLTFKEVPAPNDEDGFGIGVNTYALAIDPNQAQEDVKDDEEFTGYYIRPDDGYKIRGTFTCRTEACVEVVVPDEPNNQGNLLITAILTGWGFESDNNVEEGYVLDEDYLYFGYWLKSPVGASAEAMDYQFATLFGGNSLFNVDGDLLGNTTDALKATYEGGAAGRYVTRQLRIKDGGVDPNSPGKHGRFTAKAKLTAFFSSHPSFDESSEPGGVNNQNMIYGSITDFVDSAATDPDLGFKVDLGRDMIEAEMGGGLGAGTTATFDDGLATGTWSANFYGPDFEDTPSKRDDVTNTLPSGVAGQFNVGTTNTRVIGAFAAKKN